jgi:predicted transcriptional regulator
MKNYLNNLHERGISAKELDAAAAILQTRAKALGKAHPISVYYALAVEMALAAVEVQQESSKELGNTHSPLEWLKIMVGEN